MKKLLLVFIFVFLIVNVCACNEKNSKSFVYDEIMFENIIIQLMENRKDKNYISL